MIRISRVHLYGTPVGDLLSYASCVVNNSICLRNIKLILRPEGGILVAMPARKGGDGSWHEHYHPITPEARKSIEVAILEAYERRGSESKR